MSSGSSDALRVGVAGVGHLGQHHARIYSTLPGVKLVGVTADGRMFDIRNCGPGPIMGGSVPGFGATQGTIMVCDP